MSEKRSLLMLIAAITFGGFAACNYTDGECWYYGEGSENAGAGVGPGGGVIVPTGPSGSYGDAPPKEPQDGTDQPQDTERKPKCNSDEDSDEDPKFGKPADQYIDCRKRGLSAATCSEVCSEAGAYCPSGAPHPHKSEQPLGQLIWCKNGKPTYVCDYGFPNGDSCAVTRTPLGAFWLCSYPGGK
jgi:hypothetical protein